MCGSGHHVSRRGLREGPEKGNQHDQGHGEAALHGEAGKIISSELTHEEHLTFFNQNLMLVTASLGAGLLCTTPWKDTANV